MHELFEAFFEKPTAAGYLKLRRRLLKHASHAEGAQRWYQLQQAHARGRWPELARLCDDLLPGWGLSPRLHFLAGLAAEQLGNAGDLELERFMMGQCLAGLLATGDGSPEKPYRATYPTDPADVVEALGLWKQSQSLVRAGNTWSDVIRCHNGRELCFAVDDLVRLGVAAGEPALAYPAGRT